MGSLDCVACTATTKTESTRWTAHYGGLAQDLHLLTERRKALRWLAVGTSVPFSLWGCGGGSSDATAATDTTTDTDTGTGTGSGSGTGLTLIHL